MTNFHLMLAGDIGFAGGVLADGIAVVDGATGAPVSEGVGGAFEDPTRLRGLLADGDGGYVIFGLNMTGFSGMARYLDDGTLDTGFVVTIGATYPPSGALPVGSGGVYQAVQHGTGWLVRGNFTQINGVSRNGFARLNADGSVDTSWPSPNTAMPSTIAVQDGKAIIAADGALYRVDGAGVDGTFDPTIFPAPLNNIHVLPDDKMICTGAFAAVGATSRIGIQRITEAAAAADLTVPNLNFEDGQVLGVAAHDGGLLVFGSFTTGLGGTVNRILRLNADNTVDSGFTAPVINNQINAALELASGKILIGGTFTTVNGVARQRVAVLNADGTLDTGWVPPTVDGGVGYLHQTADGKIYIIATVSAGFSTVGGVSKPVIARLNADGTHDAGYLAPVPAQANGSTLAGYQGVLKQSDGKFLLWGFHDTIRGIPLRYVARMNGSGPTAGVVDLNPNGAVHGVSELSGGKIILVGSFTNIAGVSRNRIARLNADGTYDSSYPSTTINGGPSQSGLGGRGIIPLSSNRRLVYTTASPYLYRLDANGEIDGTYTAPTMNQGVEHAALQSDGKVILVGNFTTIGGDTRNRMCRLNADGTYDSSFGDVGLNTIGTGPRVHVLADDRIVLRNPATPFTIGGQSRNWIALLSASGVVDATWNPNPNGAVYQVKQQSSGKVIVSGTFTTIGGQTRHRVARLNADGTADTGFINWNYSTAVWDFWVQSDDYIVYAGDGTNTSNNYLLRRDPDGDYDGTFANPGFNSTVYRILQLSDDSFLFAMADGQVRHYDDVGVVDSTWNGAASNGSVHELIPVASGAAFMLMGGFTNGKFLTNGRITRVNSDGTLDTGYPGYSISPFQISKLFIDEDDELLVVLSNASRYRRETDGTTTLITGYTAGGNVAMLPDKRIYQQRNSSPFAIMRLEDDGSDDTGWGDIIASGVSTFSYFPDPATGDLIVWGTNATTAINVGGVTMSKAARLNADGSIDGSWVGATYPGNYTPNQVFDAGSGKLYMVCDYIDAQTYRPVYRLTATGTFDSWISAGVSPALFSNYVDVNPSDYSVVGWDSSAVSTQRRILKYNASGSYVAGFDQGSPGNLFWLRNSLQKLGPVKVLADGSVLVTGAFIGNGTPSQRHYTAVVLDTSGMIDLDYAPGLVAQDTTLVDVRDGKHYLGATVVATSARTMPHVALRDASGGYSDEFLTDPYLNPGVTAQSITATVNIVRMLPDGRAYIGGRFATLGGGVTFGQGGYIIYSLARILPDGSADTTFGNAYIEETTNPPPPQTQFPGIIRDIDIQPDGSVVVVGEFTMAGGRYSRPRICRVSDTGVLDEFFFVTLNSPAWSVKVRADGKIWVGGRFSQVNANAQAGIVLLNADGSVDSSFANPLVNVDTDQIVHTLMPQSDGKVIAAGTFTQINSVSSKSLRRFNADGTLDTGWDPAITTGTLTAAAQDAAGKIYGASAGNLFRLNSDGTTDGTWTDPFSGTDLILSIVPMPDGRVLVGGDFVLAGHYSNVLLNANGSVSSDLPPLPLFHTDTTPAFVNRVSWVPTPPMTMFPLMPSARVYEDRPAEIQYRTYGGTKPYQHDLIGGLPVGMSMDGPVIEGSPADPGTYYWKVVARDAAGQRIEYLTRFQVTSTDLPWPLLAFTSSATANVTRTDPDGTDQTTILSTNGNITNAIRLKNRKILLLGTFTTVGGQTRNKVALLNPDGTLDMGFTGPASSGAIDTTPLCADQLPDGKFLVGSERPTTTYFGTIYRLNTDGTIDGSFTIDSRIAMRSVQTIKVLGPGEVLIGGVINAGSTDRYHGASVFLIDEDGALDESYITTMYPAWGGTLPNDFFTSTSLAMYTLRGGSIPGGAFKTTGIYDVFIDDEGHFIVSGSFIMTGFGGGVVSESVARVLRNGVKDTGYRTFIEGIVNTTNYPSRAIAKRLIPQPDGTFLVFGSFRGFNFTVTDRGYAHIDKNGSPATPPESWAGTDVPLDNRYASVLPDGRVTCLSFVTTGGSASNARYFPDGEVDSTFSQPATVSAFFMPDNDGIDDFSADGTFSFGIQSEELDMFTADGSFYFFAGDPPPPPGPIEEVGDSLLIGALLSDLPKYGLRDGLLLGSTGVSHFDGLVRVMDSIELGDALAVVLRELLAEGFEFGATAQVNYKAMSAVADGLLLAGVVSSQLEAMNLLAVTFAFAELLRARDIEGLTEDLELGDALANAVQLGARLVEALLLEAEAGPAVLFGTTVRDGFDLAAAGSSILTAIALLREGVNFTLHLNLDDGQYVAFVINTESKGTTEYQNYPFNSFARLGGRYYGMTPDGIRELEGPDDAGSPIAARFRLAMSRMGTGQLKRMVAAYLGYSSTGELRLKTITVQPDGVKRADHYRLLAQPGAPREARVKVGQGLRSVYWGFEVEAIDGAAFAIDIIDMQPIVVEQRIQGQNGGNR